MTSTPASGTSSANPSVPYTAPRWERWTSWLFLAVFAAAGFCHVHSNTMFGQDFGLHTFGTDEMMKDAHKWFPQDFTNRPMIYWLGCAGHWLSHGKAPYEVAGSLCVLMNTLAMFFLYDSTRSFIRSPWLRLSGFAFAAFLPTTLVSTVVYAGDATGGLPFALMMWGLIRSFNAASLRSSLGYAVVALGGLCLGQYCRFPFIGLPVAILVAVILLCRWHRVTWRRGALICAITLIAPTAIGLWINRQAQIDLKGMEEHHLHDWKGTGEMSWRYLLLPKKTDVRIFNSPGYWDVSTFEGVEDHVLCLVHNYSYPALLHLGIYNDILDYACEGQNDNGAPRPEPQKTLCVWSVRIGVITSLGMFFSILALVYRSCAALFTGRNAPSTGAGLWGLMALAWFLPIVLAFPYVHYVYQSGYFLTRLIITALWGFGLVFFAELDQRLVGRPRWIAIAVAVFIFAQAAMHARSVWY